MKNPISWRRGNVNPESGPPQKGIYITCGSHRSLALLGNLSRGQKWFNIQNGHNPDYHCLNKFRIAQAKLGSVFNDHGSSMGSYHTKLTGSHGYTPLPWKELRFQHHRQATDRLQHLIGRTAIKEKKGIDLGCNVGGLTFQLQMMGAEMCGVDIDQQSIDVAKSCEHLYLTGAKFRCDELGPDFDFQERYNFALCLSTYHHIVKAAGLDGAKRFLQSISTHCRSLMIEMYPDDCSNSEFLLENSKFTKAEIVGASHWLGQDRPIFYCQL
jgi:2-polyprenyl-3-methyl-5-hydroxy-6-metoxy-1,4-benzoquinol methylase